MDAALSLLVLYTRSYPCLSVFIRGHGFPVRKPQTLDQQRRGAMKGIKAVVAILALAASAGAAAQTKLKWAHVYESSEPYHKEALWAAQEIAKRTNNRYEIQVFPASTLGKETDINQGLTLGTV